MKEVAPPRRRVGRRRRRPSLGRRGPRGNFRFRFNSLRGDVNRDGRVYRRRRSRRPQPPAPQLPPARGSGPAAYSPFHDATADGLIDVRDEAAVRQNVLRTLPAAEPTAAPASVASSAPLHRTTPITRGLFGTTTILG